MKDYIHDYERQPWLLEGVHGDKPDCTCDQCEKWREIRLDLRRRSHDLTMESFEMKDALKVIKDVYDTIYVVQDLLKIDGYESILSEFVKLFEFLYVEEGDGK
jgi:hypothetical protein